MQVDEHNVIPTSRAITALRVRLSFEANSNKEQPMQKTIHVLQSTFYFNWKRGGCEAIDGSHYNI